MRGTDEFRKRTKAYAALCIRLFVSLDRGRYEVQVLGRQMIRAGTSVAANYREACRAKSVNDFISKINTCIQEADEASLWLELLQEECNIITPPCVALLTETNELIAIMVTMSRNSQN